MNKTLVIHPYDPTTNMLEHVYRNNPDYFVCRDNGISRKDLYELISKFDRIIMLGHGSPCGLINSARNGYLIDDSFADLLKTKETVSVWCYSSSYFERYGMKGFHTGMIISEVGEEIMMFGYSPLDEEQMLKNFEQLSKVLGECIDSSPEQMREYVLANYNNNDKVTEFNRGNITII